MAIDTPARLAVLGAGPMGLEAALYARFLGYDVVVYEQGDVAASVRRWQHVRMFTPFGQNCTPLGLAAIEAQDESYQPPADDALLTGDEWLQRYLLPLAGTDLVSDHLRLQTTVVAVGKEEMLKRDMPGHEDRGDWSFRVLSRSTEGVEQVELFDGVLDCTGVFANANWLGHGGIPAIGEMALRDQIEYRLPDILGRDQERYARKHTLVIGAGMSAATNVVALAELAAGSPGTHITWITPREGAAGAGGPLAIVENDAVPERAALARRANQCAASGENITVWPRTVVEQIARSPAGPFQVILSGQHAGETQADEIIANVGFRPDNRVDEELQIAACFATQAPHSAERASAGPPALLNPEPNFYILGAKSYGRRSDFLLSAGYRQIRDLFRIIGDRESLDLYATAIRLPR